MKIHSTYGSVRVISTTDDYVTYEVLASAKQQTEPTAEFTDATAPVAQTIGASSESLNT